MRLLISNLVSIDEGIVAYFQIRPGIELLAGVDGNGAAGRRRVRGCANATCLCRRAAPPRGLGSDPCMFVKADSVSDTTAAVELSAERSEAVNSAAAGDRSSTLRSVPNEVVEELDRRQPLEFSPNSRQSRCCKSASTSSYLQGRDTSIMNFEHFIGIDVAKAKLDLAMAPDATVTTFNNDSAGHAQLLSELPQPASCLIVVESTGRYERPVVLELVNAGHVVAVVNPRQVRDFAKALGILAKTDKIDARVIARFGEVVRPRAVAETQQKQDEMNELVTRRRQLLGTRTAEKNRQETTTSKVVRKSIQKSLDYLSKEIRRIDCLLYTSPSPRDQRGSRMPSSA